MLARMRGSSFAAVAMRRVGITLALAGDPFPREPDRER